MDKSEDSWSWLIPVLLIFLIGVLCGGVIGYLIGYIKHHKIIFVPKLVPQTPPPPTSDADRPRPRRPPVEVPPSVILTTITGDKYHLVGRCGAQRVSTNRCFTPCGNCFTPQSMTHEAQCKNLSVLGHAHMLEGRCAKWAVGV